MKLIFRPVLGKNWGDLEKLFEGKGGPHPCWCMLWRRPLQGPAPASKQEKKRALHAFVQDAVPIGIIGFDHGEPVAWCSVAPRDTYRSLGGDPSLVKVWSIACFFIKRTHRGAGVVSQLVTAAEDYARSHGADHLEAFPVDEDSPSYRFMGVRALFEKLGYQLVGPVGKRRYAVAKAL